MLNQVPDRYQCRCPQTSTEVRMYAQIGLDDWLRSAARGAAGRGSVGRVSKVGVAIANVDHGGGRVTADLDTLLIALYVLADEVLPRRPRARRRPQITDAELVCLAVAQIMLDVPSERHFLRFAICSCDPRPHIHKRRRRRTEPNRNRLRRLVPDPPLVRRRAAGESLRALARSRLRGRAHNPRPLLRQPQMARQLRTARRLARANRTQPKARAQTPPD